MFKDIVLRPGDSGEFKGFDEHFKFYNLEAVLEWSEFDELIHDYFSRYTIEYISHYPVLPDISFRLVLFPLLTSKA